MKSKILSIFSLLIIGPTVLTCGTCDPVPRYLEITGIESSNMRFTDSGLNPWLTLTGSEFIKWSDYFTRFGFQMKFLSELPQNFGGTVLATSCSDPGEAGSKVGIDTIIVKTINDYNENFLAGSVINEIILVNTWTFQTDDFDEFLPLENYISENSEGVRNITFELKLAKKPSMDRTFSFDITYKLKNGKVFKHQTATVNLTK